MKFNETLKLCVINDIKTNCVPMLLGEAGIGKSSYVEELAKILCTKAFVLPCNQLADKADLTGARLVPTDNGKYTQVFYPHQVITEAIQYAIDNPRETPILFLDELNRTTPDVTSELLSLPTLRKIGSEDLPKNLRIICAGNDKGNVVSLDSASITRFVLYNVEPDAETYLNLAENEHLYPHIKTVLQRNPNLIYCKSINESFYKDNKNDDEDDDNEFDIDSILNDDDSMKQITTPRTISQTSRFLNNLTNDEILYLLSTTEKINDEEISQLQLVIEGHLGKTLFSGELLKEIANNIMSTNQKTNMSLSANKPNCYDALKNVNSIDELNDMISKLTEKEKSNALLYALYEKDDNGIIINSLLNETNNLVTEDTKLLMQLSTAGLLDEDNVAVLLSKNTILSNQLKVILEI